MTTSLNHKKAKDKAKERNFGFCLQAASQWIFTLFLLSVLTLPPLYQYRVRHHLPNEGRTKIRAKEPRTPSQIKTVLHQERQRLPHPAKRPEQLFDPFIHKAARRYDVDPALVKAIIRAESGYDPKAISKRGAKGLMQLMPVTAKALGVEDCFNPEHNIDGGVKYFKELLERFNGNVKLSLAAYNAGSRKVRLYGGVPPFRATEYYIERVFEYYSLYKQAMKGEAGRV